MCLFLSFDIFLSLCSNYPISYLSLSFSLSLSPSLLFSFSLSLSYFLSRHINFYTCERTRAHTYTQTHLFDFSLYFVCSDNIESKCALFNVLSLSHRNSPSLSLSLISVISFSLTLSLSLALWLSVSHFLSVSLSPYFLCSNYLIPSLFSLFLSLSFSLSLSHSFTCMRTHVHTERQKQTHRDTLVCCFSHLGQHRKNALNSHGKSLLNLVARSRVQIFITCLSHFFFFFSFNIFALISGL